MFSLESISSMRKPYSTLRAICGAAALCFLAMLVTPAVHARETNPPSPPVGAEHEFLSQMGLEKHQRIEYRDVAGAFISFQQFQKLQPAFPSFSIVKKKENPGTAVISLQAADTKPAAPEYKLKLGSAFPAFKLPATDDTVVDSVALRGKYVLINFYFAECAPCIKEVPMLNAFAMSHKEITVLAVTFDGPQEAKAFDKQTQFSWRTIGSAGKLIDKVGVKGFPAFALLDPQGVLVAIGSQHDMGGKEDALEKWVTKMIAAKSI